MRKGCQQRSVAHPAGGRQRLELPSSVERRDSNSAREILSPRATSDAGSPASSMLKIGCSAGSRRSWSIAPTRGGTAGNTRTPRALLRAPRHARQPQSGLGLHQVADPVAQPVVIVDHDHAQCLGTAIRAPKS